ncbi:glycoside hydrolase family 3 N-terminal domain-containing protein [Corynebacterium pacaense]|uniref:glycoside hydrolase family 3 N-terminal domain-containing protein n=1 Tax=Corynebacterium pacaense TaxID=1816684 RepID=UPI0009BBF0AA
MLTSCSQGAPAPEQGSTAREAPESAASSSTAPTPGPAPSSADDQARAQLPATQREQVASLMVVGVADFDQALDALKQGVGGIFIGSWTDESLLSDQGRNIAALREIVGRDFSVSIDFEGGRVQRATDLFGDFPAPRVMAQTMTPEQVEELAETLGTALAARGVTVDFAPVLDVDAWGLPVVGDRSFSDDPGVVATYATAFARGLEAAGVHAVFKHFPGHGRASGDSHTQGVVTPPLGELREYDLIPYGPALSGTRGAVMMGHMIVPGLGDPDLPASINPAAYELLRSGDYPGGAAYEGIIYTDDLSGMSAISSTMGAPDAVLGALRAGADQALWIDHTALTSTIDRVDSAVSSGDYPRQQMLDSALRVQRQHVTGPAAQ